MAKTRASRATSYLPVKIPIHSLSGGVGRQIPSKRLPTESENLVNFFCTTESSLDKRNGTEFLSNLFNTSVEGFTDYHWLAVDNNIAYLFLINSTPSETNDILKVFKINSETSEVTSQDVDDPLEQEIIDYIRHPGESKLEIINIGSSLLVLNPNAYAGFTSLQTGADSKYLKDFNKDNTAVEDIKGANIVYHTSITVDNAHKAEVWVPIQDYTWGRQVIDFEDPMLDTDNDHNSSEPWNPNNNPFYEWRGFEWDEGRTSNPGGELIINFNEQVLPIKDGYPFTGSGSDPSFVHKFWGDQDNTYGAALGNSIALIAIDSDNKEQTINYVWVNDEDFPTGTVIPYSTTELHNKPISIAVNTNSTSRHVATVTITDYSDLNNDDSVTLRSVAAPTVDIPFTVGSGASATFTFGASTHGTIEDATLTIIDAAATPITKIYKIKDSGATASSQEFDEGATATLTAVSFCTLVNSSNGHNGTITATNDEGAVTLIQTVGGTASNTTITDSTSPSWNDICDVNPPDTFTGGLATVWIPHTSNNVTATNLAAIINLHADFISTASTNVVTIHHVLYGTGANTTVSLSDSGSVGMSKTNFTTTSPVAYTTNQISNGWADASELKIAIEHINGHTTDESVPYFTTIANKVSPVDPSELPGRIIIRQKVAGRRGNTNVRTNDYSYIDGDAVNKNLHYNMNNHTSSTIKNTFSGAVEEDEESINDTFSPTWSSADPVIGDSNYWSIFPNAGVSYGIWEVKTYLPAEELPGPTNELLAEDTEFRGSTLRPHKDLVRWKRVENTDSFFLRDPTSNTNIEATRFIPVEEYVYPSSTTLHLGQSVARLSDLKFPPDSTDSTAYNGGASVVATLSSLYPDLVNEGNGKIYYLSQAYLDNNPGWYLVTNREQAPYLKKIRAPGKRTVIDQRRMPMMIYLDSVTNKWSMRMIDWDPKHSGDEDTNRGPGLFFDPVTGDPKESKISTMAFYRDRLFLTNDDTVMASRSGDWDNFFLADPETITDTDPLDLMVASNDYTPIKNLIPFKDFLFVGTSGNTQYELMGSQNILSPLTASFAPSAFYPMLTEVKPVPMNNSLFFFAKKKMYIYFGQKAVVAEQAFELSRHIPEYLPESLKVVTPSSHGSMVFALEENTDSTQPTNVFVYRNQIANERVIQNAFYKFQFKAVTKSSVEFIKAWNKYLYLVSYCREIAEPYSPHVTLSRISLDVEAENIPRVDDRRLLTLPYTAIFDSLLQKTTVTLTGIGYPIPDTLITSAGEVLALTVSDVVNGIYTLEGNVTDLFSGTGEADAKWIGVNFTSTVELSTAYVRDEVNNIVPGTFNIRYCTLQTYNSHKFNVDVSVNNRDKQTYSFNQEVIDNTDDHDWIGNPVVTGLIKEHQVRFPLLGFNQDITITITSDNPHPLNIASLQYAGKFKGITRYHNS